MERQIREIDIHGARARLDAGDAVFVDIRDAGSFDRAHIDGATHLSDDNAQSFVAETDKDAMVIVYCYHGNSSLMGADFLMQSGFRDVYSMTGGFEAWRVAFDV